MQKLRDYFKGSNINQIQELFKRRVIVTEKLQMPTIYVEWNGTQFKFLKNNKVTLDRVDRTIQSLYEIAVKHFFAMNNKIRTRIPSNWRFGFDYVPSPEISEFKYTETPHNNLILTHIHEMKGSKVVRTLIEPEILKKWALILDVEAPNVIFDGVLSQDTQNELIALLEIGDEEFKAKYDYDINTEKETSFTIKIFRLFDQNRTRTTLQLDLENEIDGLILTFINDKKARSLKLEDFLREGKRDREASHIQQIAISDFLEFLSLEDLSKIELVEKELDLKYIELMSVVFNKYIKENATKYIGVDFEAADFADHQLFKLNTMFITNQDTLKLVSNQILAELFKIILGTFRKKKKKETEFFTAELLTNLNDVIQKVSDFIKSDKKPEVEAEKKIETGVESNEKLNIETYNGMFTFKNYILNNED